MERVIIIIEKVVVTEVREIGIIMTAWYIVLHIYVVLYKLYSAAITMEQVIIIIGKVIIIIIEKVMSELWLMRLIS